ncbi:MAG: hypothetical protein RL375_540, partial [Pseudomonadota bacterium]
MTDRARRRPPPGPRHPRLSLRARAALALAGLTLTLIGAALNGPGHPGDAGDARSWLPTLDHAVLDRFQAATAPTGPAPGVAVVDIDDASLAEVGQWPWPRYRSAALVRRVADGAPRSIGLDILFPEPDRTSLTTVQQAFERDFGICLDISGAPAAMRDNDAYLAHTLAAAPTVGARYFFFTPVPGQPTAGGQQALPNRSGVTSSGEQAAPPRRSPAVGLPSPSGRGTDPVRRGAARLPVITGDRTAISPPRA